MLKKIQAFESYEQFRTYSCIEIRYRPGKFYEPCDNVTEN